MRLQIRADPRPVDARALFSHHHQPSETVSSPPNGFRLALPPSPSTARSTLSRFPVPTTFGSFKSPASISPQNYLRSVDNQDDPIFISVNERIETEAIRIPSLTQTFLQNRLWAAATTTNCTSSTTATATPSAGDAERSRGAKSVIKINVSPSTPGITSTAENCTIVTISSSSPPLPVEQINAGTAPSVLIRFDEQPTPPSQSRKNNSVVRVNVADEPSYYSNCNPVEDTLTATNTTSSSTIMNSSSLYSTTDESASFDADFSLHYMSCAINGKLTEQEVGLLRPYQEDDSSSVEPIYEEIAEISALSMPPPPPLPLQPPPQKVDDGGIVIPPRSIFEGASKNDILTYLAGAKERCRIPAEIPRFVIEETDTDVEVGTLEADAEELARGAAAEPAVQPHSHSAGRRLTDFSRRISHLSSVSDSSDELACFLACAAAAPLEKQTRKNSADIERNDSGVGSETSQCSRSKWQQVRANSFQEDQQLVCEDCDQAVESNNSDNYSGLAFAPLVCRKCSKRRIERREIITEIVETEEKYGRDLRIILDEFYRPMLVAGLLTADQLSAVFLNVEELLEHNTMLAEKLRDGYEIAIEQGDEDLLTFNVGQIFLDATPMLHAFESYCTRQGNAALLLANLEREKELLKIFLRVSQMENTVLRRMNLNSFLMVPVQRVTKYPLLLARLYKVTPEHHVVQRESLKEARHNIEMHLEHINSVTKDIGSTKIWRRISMINGRRVNGDVDDIISIKLQKIAVEVLEWGHDEVRFVMEGRLLYAQCTDYNWKRSGRTVKVVPINALLVTLGKPTENYNPELDDLLMFPPKSGIREASLLLMKEKSGKYSLVREPLFLDSCIIYCDGDYEEYFEVQEIHSKETYIFKGEDGERTKRWFKQLQYHCQGLGCWRKRRNALANIMINGMKIRN